MPSRKSVLVSLDLTASSTTAWSVSCDGPCLGSGSGWFCRKFVGALVGAVVAAGDEGAERLKGRRVSVLARLLTSSWLYLDVPLPVHELGQRAAESERRRRGARLLASVEDALVAVLLGQARQSIDVEIDLHAVVVVDG